MHQQFLLLRTTLALLTAASFLLGAVCSGVAGYVGMWVSVRANVRVSGAARRSAREALQIALRAGGFSALVVLGMVCHNARNSLCIRSNNTVTWDCCVPPAWCAAMAAVLFVLAATP